MKKPTPAVCVSIFLLLWVVQLVTIPAGNAATDASGRMLTLPEMQKATDQVHKVTLSMKNSPIEDFFAEVQKQTSLKVIYDAKEVSGKKVSVTAKDRRLEEVLSEVLYPQGLSFAIGEDRVEVNRKTTASGEHTVSGTIRDDYGETLPGATVRVKGMDKYAIADLDGQYSLKVPSSQAVEVIVSMMSMEEQTFTIEAVRWDLIRDITLGGSELLEELVVTGIYTRPEGNYTGSAIAIKSDDIGKVGGNNVLSALSTLDPSIYVADNFSLGSDPNALPDMSLRGVSSLNTNVDINTLKSRQGKSPNQPLFILDGFEASIETVMDMDMNRIASITTLKDASAKALYGSKAANGVIVIETKKLEGKEHRITYSGSVTLEMPDLSSYNLTNAMEKLEVEKADGYYDNATTIHDWETKQRLYNERKRLILSGLNTDWIAKPVRVGVGQKHNVSVELGDAESLRSTVDFTYQLINGAMKGSYRNNISTTVNSSYRRDNLLFRNVVTINSNHAEDSPYGSFSEYARMNPYWQAVDEKGNVLRWAEKDIPNPLYNATIGTSLKSKYLQVIDNFFTEWRVTPDFKATMKVGVSTRKNQLDHFLPPMHTTFAFVAEKDYDTRGSYEQETGSDANYSGDINLSYNKTFGKHTIFTDGGFFVSEHSGSTYRHVARGFANASVTDITFANGYLAGSKPSGWSSLVREASFLWFTSYDYENKYLAEATFRESASSLYGKNNRWSPSWSVGLGWNVHNEKWMPKGALNRLKLRASAGLTGNQNFDTSAAIATYKYYPDAVYGNQTGAYLSKMPNPDLKWEQKMDYNVGLDLVMKNISLTLDFYRSDTRNMLTDLSIPTITGFSIVKDNLGLVRNSGLESRLSYTPWQGDRGFVTLYGSVVHNKNYIVRLSDSLREYNEKMMEQSKESTNSSPVPLYQDGQSMTTIFAVQSAGIDPTNGRELFVKRTGELTYDYDPTDLIPAGDSAPKVRGNAGISAEYAGVGLNLTLSYMWGGQQYNYTLVDRVENADIQYNVDRRLAEGRWRVPGQESKYKKFNNNVRTRPTTRFVQDRNELTISAISLYYNFPQEVAEKFYAKRLKLMCNLNNLYTFSSIEVERGTSYPFARQLSFSAIVTF